MTSIKSRKCKEKYLENERSISFCNNYKYMFDKENSIFILKNQKFDVNSQFAYYLSGLIEGDGSIIVPSWFGCNSKKKYPLVKITFVDKDLPLAEKIKSELKTGKIYKGKGKYFILVFYRLDTIFLIIHLINGKMRTPKIEALNRLIDWFNVNYNTSLIKLGLDISNLECNAWLAGFIESDGSFYSYFNINKENIAINISCYMRLSQRQNYPSIYSELNLNNIERNLGIEENKNIYSYLDIMEQIRIFFDVKNIRKINRTRLNNFVELGYEIRTSKLKSNEILISYLNKYPLYSSKYLDYLNWKNIYDLKKNKGYKLKEGTELLLSLKLSMNTNRVDFDWKHLNNFWLV